LHYKGWTPDLGDHSNQSGASATNLFPASQKGMLDYSLLSGDANYWKLIVIMNEICTICTWAAAKLTSGPKRNNRAPLTHRHLCKQPVVPVIEIQLLSLLPVGSMVPDMYIAARNNNASRGS
jgi:hypothetical protein